jgi:hypothetical protein
LPRGVLLKSPLEVIVQDALDLADVGAEALVEFCRVMIGDPRQRAWSSLRGFDPPVEQLLQPLGTGGPSHVLGHNMVAAAGQLVRMILMGCHDERPIFGKDSLALPPCQPLGFIQQERTPEGNLRLGTVLGQVDIDRLRQRSAEGQQMRCLTVAAWPEKLQRRSALAKLGEPTLDIDYC